MSRLVKVLAANAIATAGLGAAAIALSSTAGADPVVLPIVPGVPRSACFGDFWGLQPRRRRRCRVADGGDRAQRRVHHARRADAEHPAGVTDSGRCSGVADSAPCPSRRFRALLPVSPIRAHPPPRRFRPLRCWLPPASSGRRSCRYSPRSAFRLSWPTRAGRHGGRSGRSRPSRRFRPSPGGPCRSVVRWRQPRRSTRSRCSTPRRNPYPDQLRALEGACRAEHRQTGHRPDHCRTGPWPWSLVAAADPAIPLDPGQLPGLQAVQSLSPVVQRAAANPKSAQELLLAAASQLAGNATTPEGSMALAQAVTKFVQDGGAAGSHPPAAAVAQQAGGPAHGTAPLLTPGPGNGPIPLEQHVPAPGAVPGTEAHLPAESIPRTPSVRPRRHARGPHPGRRAGPGSPTPAPVALAAPAPAPAAAAALFDPAKPPTQEFMYPSISSGCLRDGGNVIATAISVAGPAKIPAPGPGPGQMAYVFTAVGTPPHRRAEAAAQRHLGQPDHRQVRHLPPSSPTRRSTLRVPPR